MKIATNPLCQCGHARLNDHRPRPEGGCLICPVGVCTRYGTYLRDRRDGSQFECSNANWNKHPDWEPGVVQPWVWTHGARSPKRVAARAAAILEALTERIPAIGELTRDQVERYCEVQAKETLYGEYIDEVLTGERTVDGSIGVGAIPDRVIQNYIRLAALAQKMAQELGMDPTGLAKLAKDFGWAKRLHDTRLEAIQSKGRALRSGQPV